MLNAIIALVFGLGFIFMTETLLPMLAITENVMGFRVYGSAVIGNSCLTFFARDSEDSPARKAILINEVVGFTILNIMMLIFLDLTNLMVWATIILHFAFVGGYAYFLFKKE
ncbi:MAG: hypothetical protein ACTSVZ_07785 [Promethearchaeota archaeon]